MGLTTKSGERRKGRGEWENGRWLGCEEWALPHEFKCWLRQKKKKNVNVDKKNMNVNEEVLFECEEKNKFKQIKFNWVDLIKFLKKNL